MVSLVLCKRAYPSMLSMSFFQFSVFLIHFLCSARNIQSRLKKLELYLFMHLKIQLANSCVFTCFLRLKDSRCISEVFWQRDCSHLVPSFILSHDLHHQLSCFLFLFQVELHKFFLGFLLQSLRMSLEVVCSGFNCILCVTKRYYKISL